MKISTTFVALISVLFAGLVDAQPVINRSHLYVPGKHVFAQNAANPAGNGSSGSNVTWDFSGLVPEDGIGNIYIGHADTTLFHSDFPGSNVAATASFGGFSYYNYLHVNNDGIEYLGDIIPGVTITTYSNAEQIVVFPLTMNTAWQDDFSYALDFFVSPIRTTAEGSLSALVDGFGTLVLPHTTFNDVLRLRTVTITADTTNLGLGISERVVTRDTSYVWLSPSYHGPLCASSYTHLTRTVYLMDVDTTIVDMETEEFRSFSFDPMSGETSSVPRDIAPGKYDLRISPNPFVQSIDLTFTSERSGLVRFALQDMYGRVVYAQMLQCHAGSNAQHISLPAMPAGVYLALLETPDGADVQKLIGTGNHR